MEHALETLAGLTHQIADRPGPTAVQPAPMLATHRVLAFTKIEQRIGGSAPAQLVVQTRQRHIVALTRQLALSVNQLFGNNKQRDTFDTGHRLAIRAGNLGQHQVHDVFGQLMVARADPHLVALEAVAWPQRFAFKISAIGLGARGDIGQG